LLDDSCAKKGQHNTLLLGSTHLATQKYCVKTANKPMGRSIIVRGISKNTHQISP